MYILWLTWNSEILINSHSFKMPLALAGGNKKIKWIGFSQNSSYYHFILRIAFSRFNSVFIGFG
jgi:hypothetical protein